MADPRVFTLIGNFTDNITPALTKINKSLETVKDNLNQVSKATKPLKKDFKDLADLSNNFSASLKTQASDIRDITSAMRAMRNEMGRVNRAYKAGGRGVVSDVRKYAPPPPPPPPPPRVPRGYEAPGYGRSPAAPLGRREGVLGDVISGTLISNAIIQGFQVGVGILRQGVSTAFGTFAERAKDQLEDIGAAGGIYSAGQFANIPGFPKTFQEAMDMQDKINKQMAAIASNLPGTTHDYVENSRRLVDTTAQVMANDMKGFTKLATELSGKMNISSKEAFRVVNVEIAKATTMLEKLNPAKTVVPMTQLVEDMMKDEKVTIGGLRKYVSFRRSTTFEAALQRNIDELNKTGAGTAERLKMIIKVLREAAPPEMVGAFQSSVEGVIEGLRSALIDPDVGLFGLSRTLSLEVKKFDRVTGKQIGKEFTNFFKMFSEVFGNIGNLINNSIMPGLQALYEPFKAIAQQFDKLREFSFKVFERQQRYNAYFAERAAELGMSREDFKVFEKGGISVMMDILQGFGMLDNAKYKKIIEKMTKGGSEEEVAKNMKEIYSDIIPMIFESPFFKKIGATIGKALAGVFKEIAKIMKALLSGKYGTNEFVKAFYEGGGMSAVNEILMYLAEGFGKLLMKLAELYIGSFVKAIGSGNFAAAGVLGALGVVFGGPAIAGIKIIAKGMNMLVKAFKYLLASKVIPTSVKDLGSVITDPRRMLPAATPSAGPLAKGMSALFKFFMDFRTYLRGVGPRFLSFFKGFLGKLSIFGAVITSIISLFQGKDLAQSLADGIGPLLGAALGAALVPILGPIGPMIGSAIVGWIGSMKAVTEPLAEGIRAVFGTFQTTFGFLIQIGGDLGGVINGLVRRIPGVSKEFDALRFVVTTLMSFFRLLELMIIGLYEGYLRIKEKFFGLNDEEKTRKQQLFQERINKTAALELDMKQAYNKKARQQYMEELNNLRAAGKGGEERARTVEGIIRQIDARLKANPGGTPAKPPVPAKPTPRRKPDSVDQLDAITAFLGGDPTKPLQTPKIVPTAKPGISPALAQTNRVTAITAVQTTQINSKTTQQVSKISQTNQLLTAISVKMDMLVSAVSSGAFKFINRLPLFFPPPPSKTKDGTTVSPLYSYGSWSATGSIGSAIMSELARMPSGAHLVVANSSETIMPKGYSMTMSQGGGGTTINGGIHVSVNGSGVNDADELASIIALKIGDAVAQARSASYYV